MSLLKRFSHHLPQFWVLDKSSEAHFCDLCSCNPVLAVDYSITLKLTGCRICFLKEISIMLIYTHLLFLKVFKAPKQHY
jgi:hypothetical protein